MAKILKSAAVPNPAQNAMSTLSCQASGSTLSRSLDDVSKLSVTDAAFAAGSVGFAVNAKAGVAHRADNFSAVMQ